MLRLFVTSSLIVTIAALWLVPAERAQAQVAQATTSSKSAVTELAIRRSREHIRYGLNLAERGAVYSAQDEFLKALRLIATDLDLAAGTHDRQAALEAGLRVLRSAEASARNASAELSAAVPDSGAASPSAPFAMQRQLLDAQRQLSFAAGHDSTASVALYLLGQAQMASAGETAEEKALAGPKTIALYQSALDADPENYLAANELGALLAKYGQWEEAERVLAHGVAVAPQPAMWHNLAIVYERMGNAEAARYARAECEALAAARRSKGENAELSKSNNVAPRVRWASTAEFARCAASDDLGPPIQSDKSTIREGGKGDSSILADQRCAPAPAKAATVHFKPDQKQASGLELPDWLTAPLRNLGGRSGPTLQN